MDLFFSSLEYSNYLLPEFPTSTLALKALSAQKPEWPFKIINQIKLLPCLELLKGFSLPLRKNKTKQNNKLSLLWPKDTSVLYLISAYFYDFFLSLSLSLSLSLLLLFNRLHPHCPPHCLWAMPCSFLGYILWGNSHCLETIPYPYTTDFSFLFLLT